MADEIFLEAGDGNLIVDKAEAYEITPKEARDYLDAPGETDLAEWFESQLDSAQGNILTGGQKEAWIVIHIIGG